MKWVYTYIYYIFFNNYNEEGRGNTLTKQLYNTIEILVIRKRLVPETLNMPIHLYSILYITYTFITCAMCYTIYAGDERLNCNSLTEAINHKNVLSFKILLTDYWSIH